MGATSSIHIFDERRFREEIAGPVRALLTAPEGSASPPSWLADALGDAEQRELGRGRGVGVLGACEVAREDLGVRDVEALLEAIAPSATGACGSSACGARERCPLHPAGQAPVKAAVVMELVQRAASARCLGPAVSLGREGVWSELVAWYYAERGLPEPPAFVDYANEPALAYLLRLGKRGALVGWGEDGASESLLGWLDRDEAGALAESLAPWLRERTAPAPAAVIDFDPFVGATWLLQMREITRAIHDCARRASASGRGVALVRR